MRTLNNAFEVLTGVDPNTLEFEESDTTYFARTGPDRVIEVEGIRLEISISGGTPQDWVYAASFAATNGGAYLAMYSGKVILLSRDGQPLAAYDIGTCPSEIVDIGRHTYFLTPTRLYVVEDGTKLAAFLDVFQQGRLLVSESGFGLLASRKLRWFTAAGAKVGELVTRDPGRFMRSRQARSFRHGSTRWRCTASGCEGLIRRCLAARRRWPTSHPSKLRVITVVSSMVAAVEACQNSVGSSAMPRASMGVLIASRVPIIDHTTYGYADSITALVGLEQEEATDASSSHQVGRAGHDFARLGHGRAQRTRRAREVVAELQRIQAS